MKEIQNYKKMKPQRWKKSKKASAIYKSKYISAFLIIHRRSQLTLQVSLILSICSGVLIYKIRTNVKRSINNNNNNTSQLDPA